MTPPRELPENAPFFAGLREGRLRVQECEACGARQLGSSLCRRCGAPSPRWVDASGLGTVAAVTTVRRGPTPGVAVPYVLALVELDEGPRLVARLDSPPLGPLEGGRVAVRFGAGDAAVVPTFAPVVGAEG